MRKHAKRDRSRELRSGMTAAERKLWQVLKGRQLDGFRFRRQHPMGPYIADFACLELGVVIEVDGGQHCASVEDRHRDRFMEAKGFKVLRFWNNEIMANLEGVYSVIAQCLVERCPPPHLFLLAGKGPAQGD